jgi:hypothetical protein
MKFNSQICTTKEQSERLLALGLKPETANMRWERISEKYAYYPSTKMPYASSDIPAWSLHRLMEMMPNEIRKYDAWASLSINNEFVQYEYYDIDYNHGTCLEHFNDGTLFDNICDAYEWLIKEGYFPKEYLV